jgi:hypothetical protein
MLKRGSGSGNEELRSRQKESGTAVAEYRAKDGQVDRHGEMTGAITFNMVLTMLPVAIWSFFIGPWLLPDRVWVVMGIAVAMALVLPLVFFRLSRRIWAWFSAWTDKL